MGGGGASFLARSRALSNGRTKEVYGQASCSCNLSYGFVAPLRDKNTRRNLVQHHPKEKFRLKINSRTSRFANVLFANEFGQFASFFRLIKGLKNKVYTCVSDILVSGLKEGGIYMYVERLDCFVIETTLDSTVRDVCEPTRGRNDR